MKPRFGRKSLRETLAANNAINGGLEKMFGDLREAKGIAQPGLAEIKDKRVVLNRTDPDALEAGVLREVGQLLAVHPRVLLAVRQNGGAAQAADGIHRIWYYKIVRSKEPMRISDYWGLLSDGPFAIECKKRDWSFAGTEREIAQQAFLEQIALAGGRAGFATSAEQAQQIIEGALPK